MSKSRNLFFLSSLSLVFIFALAYNFADRNITKLPSEPRTVNAEYDFDLRIIAAANAANAPRQTGSPLGLGRKALDEEITAWDLDIAPDGTGLPVGSGSVSYGEEIFSEQCGACHGDFAEGVDRWPELAGGEGTLADDDPLKTVGSYWPYLSTAWDYIHRSMPFGYAQSLSDDDVYAMLAYILYSNDIIDDEDFVLSNENFLDVEMPNAEGFIIDDRDMTEYPIFSQDPCMEDCKVNVEVTMRARVLDVTPEDDGS
ncbi:MAG: cytochrome C [Marinovum sp.]|nr:cytochrome C [Marinovum sp.]